MLLHFLLSILISHGYVTVQYGNLQSISSLTNTILFDGGTLSAVSVYNDTTIPPTFWVNDTANVCFGVWDCATAMCNIYTQKSQYDIAYIGIAPRIYNSSNLQCAKDILHKINNSKYYVISHALILLSIVCVTLANFIIGILLIYKCYNPIYGHELIIINETIEQNKKQRYKPLFYIGIGFLKIPAIISLIVFIFYAYPNIVTDHLPFEITLFSAINNTIFTLIYFIDYIVITRTISNLFSE